MSKLNTNPRKFNTKQSMVTIVDPRIDVHSREFELRGGFRRSDFIDVPRLDTRGEWPLSHMIPDEQLVHLAVMAGHLKAQPKSRRTYNDRWNEKHAVQVAERKKVKEGKERRVLKFGGWL